MKFYLLENRRLYNLHMRLQRVGHPRIREMRLADMVKKELIERGFDLEKRWHAFENDRGWILYIQEDHPRELFDNSEV